MTFEHDGQRARAVTVRLLDEPDVSAMVYPTPYLTSRPQGGIWNIRRELRFTRRVEKNRLLSRSPFSTVSGLRQ